MARELTIRQVADEAGASVHTLRYYERIGLLPPVGRAVSGHRRYSAGDVEWVTLLRRLRATGMPIAEMQRFAALVQRGEATIAARRALLEERRRQLRERHREIDLTLALLDDKIAHYRAWEREHGEGAGRMTPSDVHTATPGKEER